MTKFIDIHTDGSCDHKTRDGGLGVVINYNGHVREIFKGYSNTTVGRMELRAVLEALKAIENKTDYVCRIHSDSKYVVNTVGEWMYRWERMNYAGKKNVDIIKDILEETRKFEDGNVQMFWVKGHSGVPENELADALANIGRTECELVLCQPITTETIEVSSDKVSEVTQTSGKDGNIVDVHWNNMPEFIQEKKEAYQKITIRFDNEEAVQDFAKKIGQKLTPKSKSIWHPKLVRGIHSNKRYTDAT